MRLAPLLGLLGLVPTMTLHADNGQLARATVVSELTIDGDFSDWPAELERHPVGLNNNGDPRPGDADFDAAFRAAFDPATNQVFVALEVRDDVHHVSEAEGVSWQEQDGVILYLDAEHSARGSGAALYSANGPQRQMLTPQYTWDTETLELDWDDAELAVVRSGDVTRYEWRLDVPRDLATPRSLGFDLVVIDHDGPDSGTGSQLLTWGPGLGKSQGGGRLGDLVLLSPDVARGRLEGQVRLDPAAIPADNDDDQLLRRRVRLVSQESPELWVQVRSDDVGNYGIELPTGSWTVSLPDGAYGAVWSEDYVVFAPDAPVEAVVEAGETTTVGALNLGVAAAPAIQGEAGRLFDWGPDDVPELERLVTELMTHYRIPGVSLALVNDGALVYHQTFGTRNAFTGEPVTPETLFEAASITKIVFAFAVNRMAERGEIDLDKPLYQYLPFEELAYDKRYQKITARHVLSHQSGMPNWRWQNDDGRIDLKFYPGIQYGYSGEGYEYLGRVVAHLAGKPLETVLMEEVQTPMGFAERTFYADSDALRAAASRGHFGGKPTPHIFADAVGPAHSMVTEAGVFSNFMINLLDRQGLSEEGYAAMFEPQVAIPAEDNDPVAWPARYGLGFHLMNSPEGLVFGHGGNNGDFMCNFEAYDAHDAGFIVFTNGNAGIRLINALREFLVIGEPGAPEPAVAP
jgi:CubicO group peptidase (beta-lactamase class C family)